VRARAPSLSPACLCACMGEDIAHTSTCLHDFRRVTPTSRRPGFGRHAGRSAAHLLNYPLGPRQISNPPADACETPGTNALRTLSCRRRLTVAVPPPAWCTPGLAGSAGSQVLPALAFLCSPSSELWGLSAHIHMTPVDS